MLRERGISVWGHVRTAGGASEAGISRRRLASQTHQHNAKNLRLPSASQLCQREMHGGLCNNYYLRLRGNCWLLVDRLVEFGAALVHINFYIWLWGFCCGKWLLLLSKNARQHTNQYGASTAAVPIPRLFMTMSSEFGLRFAMSAGPSTHERPVPV